MKSRWFRSRATEIRPPWLWLVFVALFAADASGPAQSALTVNGINADYTTEHLSVDETAGDSIPIVVLFSPNTSNVVEADVFSNLNRRNRADLGGNGDGMSNAAEDAAGTDPMDAHSLFDITGLAAGGNVVTWTSVTDKTYQALTTGNLSLPFLPLGGSISADGPLTSFTNGAGGGVEFYRIQVFPQPDSRRNLPHKHAVVILTAD